MKSINATLRSELRRFFYNLVLFLLGIYPLFWFLYLVQYIIDIIIFNSARNFNEGFVVFISWLKIALISWLEIGLGMFLMMHLITYKFPTRRAASLSILLFWTGFATYGRGYVLMPMIVVFVPMLISLIVLVMFYRLPPSPSEKNP